MKHKSKRFLAVLLAALVCLGALTACGGGNESGNAGGEAAGQEEGYVPGGGLSAGIAGVEN